jgi:hypothetical protein
MRCTSVINDEVGSSEVGEDVWLHALIPADRIMVKNNVDRVGFIIILAGHRIAYLKAINIDDYPCKTKFLCA